MPENDVSGLRTVRNQLCELRLGAAFKPVLMPTNYARQRYANINAVVIRQFVTWSPAGPGRAGPGARSAIRSLNKPSRLRS